MIASMKSEYPVMATPKTIRVEPGSEIDQLLDETGDQPVELERRGVRFLITRMSDDVEMPRIELADEHDVWAGYDPAKVLRAVGASAGALQGVDTEQLKRDLAEERAQDSTGRPA